MCSGPPPDAPRHGGLQATDAAPHPEAGTLESLGEPARGEALLVAQLRVGMDAVREVDERSIRVRSVARAASLGSASVTGGRDRATRSGPSWSWTTPRCDQKPDPAPLLTGDAVRGATGTGSVDEVTELARAADRGVGRGAAADCGSGGISNAGPVARASRQAWSRRST